MSVADCTISPLDNSASVAASSSSSSISSSAARTTLPPNSAKMADPSMSDFSFVWRSLVAGGVAGMCAKTTIAPLERMKILLQAQNAHYRNYGVLSGLGAIVRKESVWALYKGNGAQMVRVFPYAAIQFTFLEKYKKLLNRTFPGGGRRLLAGVSGSLAGVTAVIATYPLDTVRARLAFQMDKRYTGIWHTITEIVKKEGGVGALYRGLRANLIGMVPYAFVMFFSFEQIKYLCMTHLPDYTCAKLDSNTGGLVLSVPAKAAAGGMAGVLAHTSNYPLDVTRRRMQLAYMSKDTQQYGTSMASTLLLIYRRDGIVRGLYRGLTINYLRAVPMVGVLFMVQELAKEALGLDTGLDAGLSIKTG